MLLFAGYDPGSKNHIYPIYRKALDLQERAQFIDLTAREDLIRDSNASKFVRDFQPTVFIAGVSTHLEEAALFESCKYLDVPTIAIIDLSAQGIFNSDPTGFADRFLVNSYGCSLELQELGVDASKIVLAGSTHLEQLADTNVGNEYFDLSEYFGVDPSINLVPFFCRPNLSSSIAALASLEGLISHSDKNLFVVARPHPRDIDRHFLESACKKFNNIQYDSGDEISTIGLLRQTKLSLSMGSTTSLESVAIGVPSAFYLIDWDYSGYEGMFRNVPSIPRIKNPREFKEFLETALRYHSKSEDFLGDPKLENYSGALDRSWNAICDMKPK